MPHQFLTGTYFILTILSVPPLIFAVSGEGFTEVGRATFSSNFGQRLLQTSGLCPI